MSEINPLDKPESRPELYPIPAGQYVPADGTVIRPDGSTRKANMDDMNAAAALSEDGKADVRIVEVDGHTQTLSDGTFYDTEFDIYYE